MQISWLLVPAVTILVQIFRVGRVEAATVNTSSEDNVRFTDGKENHSLSVERRVFDEKAFSGAVGSDLSNDFEESDGDGDEVLEMNKVFSVTDFREENGEVLVPCFGMWWPSGRPVNTYVYEYVDVDNVNEQPERRGRLRKSAKRKTLKVKKRKKLRKSRQKKVKVVKVKKAKI